MKHLSYRALRGQSAEPQDMKKSAVVVGQLRTWDKRPILAPTLSVENRQQLDAFQF
jgi:hypothetical protein